MAERNCLANFCAVRYVNNIAPANLKIHNVEVSSAINKFRKIFCFAYSNLRNFPNSVWYFKQLWNMSVTIFEVKNI